MLRTNNIFLGFVVWSILLHIKCVGHRISSKTIVYNPEETQADLLLQQFLNPNSISELDSESDSNEDEVQTVREDKYQPTWESLDSRPLPKWYDEAKIGIFIHWGVFSVPSYGGAWFWNSWTNLQPDVTKFMTKNYPPNFAYQDFGREFTAEFFDPYDWAKVFKKSGAQYVVLTTKHHEGYTLWPSKYSFGWNAMDVGPKRDLVGQLSQAIREITSLRFGIYHSLYEWFNPLYLSDKKSGYVSDEFIRFKTMPELREAVEAYKPDVVWSDGDWEASDDYWKSKEFLAWLYNESPVNATVVTNDRWGKGAMCKHGGFYTCSDHFNPGVLQPHKWENCMTLDKSAWAYRRTAKANDFLTPLELLTEVAKTISCGGNILINIGPTKEGTLPPIMEERFLQLGEWLEVNGAAVYKSVPWKVAQNDTINKNIWYTSNPAQNKVYAIILGFPGVQVQLGAVHHTTVRKVELLGSEGMSLKWNPVVDGIVVSMPRQEENKSKWAWTLLITLL